MRTLVVLWVLVGAAWGQATSPDLNAIAKQSKSVANIPAFKDGCGWVYRKDSQTVECVERILVTLSGGKSTTVSNTAVKTNSRVSCGCSGMGNSSAKCTERARWLARYSVDSVANGSFVLKHSYASGDGSEQIVCEVG